MRCPVLEKHAVHVSIVVITLGCFEALEVGTKTDFLSDMVFYSCATRTLCLV